MRTRPAGLPALLAATALVAAPLAGCGASDASTATTSASTTTTGASTATTTTTTTGGAGGSGGAGGAAPTDLTVGGDRPTTVYLPDGYAKGTPAPLLVMLHGYGVSGAVEDIYLGLRAVAAKKGFVYAHPDGTVDAQGKRFWNATDGCCDFGKKGVDDSAYLAGLVEEIRGKVDVDPKRIYFVGHSNGGFMSHRMACDHADLVAAIGSLAGATWMDPAKCAASEPVSVLQIHGDADADVKYEGTLAYPGAVETVKRWATIDGCAGEPDDGGTLDLEDGLAGAETSVTRHAGCQPGGAAELWTLHGGGHVPAFAPAFLEELTAFLLAHPKP